MSYILHLVILINIYALLVVGTNIIVGWNNILTLCQGAFYGIGAYLTALMALYYHWPIFPAIILVTLVTGLTGVFAGVILKRLNDDYLVLGTLGFQLIVSSVLNNCESLTKGPYGITGIHQPDLFGTISLKGDSFFFVLSTLMVIIVLCGNYYLYRSPYGRLLRGVRDDQIALLSLGNNVSRLKITALFISAFVIGIAGFLYASYSTYIDPASFSLDESIFILTGLIIGGAGINKGPVAGAVLVILIPELLKWTGMPNGVAANIQQILYGLVIILLMRYVPKGIFGKMTLK